MVMQSNLVDNLEVLVTMRVCNRTTYDSWDELETSVPWSKVAFFREEMVIEPLIGNPEIMGYIYIYMYTHISPCSWLDEFIH